MLLTIGGYSGLEKSSGIYALQPEDNKWKLVEKMPYPCFLLDIIPSGGGLFVIDGDSKNVLQITVEGESFCYAIVFISVLTGLAKHNPIPLLATKPNERYLGVHQDFCGIMAGGHYIIVYMGVEYGGGGAQGLRGSGPPPPPSALILFIKILICAMI